MWRVRVHLMTDKIETDIHVSFSLLSEVKKVKYNRVLKENVDLTDVVSSEAGLTTCQGIPTQEPAIATSLPCRVDVPLVFKDNLLADKVSFQQRLLHTSIFSYQSH